MIRLVQFEHHIVTDVDDVVDRSHSGCPQPARHPIGRLTNLNAGQHESRKPRTPISVNNLHVRGSLVTACVERESVLLH